MDQGMTLRLFGKDLLKDLKTATSAGVPTPALATPGVLISTWESSGLVSHYKLNRAKAGLT